MYNTSISEWQSIYFKSLKLWKRLLKAEKNLSLSLLDNKLYIMEVYELSDGLYLVHNFNSLSLCVFLYLFDFLYFPHGSACMSCLILILFNYARTVILGAFFN